MPTMVDGVRVLSHLRPSSSKIWTKCARAPRVLAGVVDEPTPFAIEGTRAHYLAEVCLKGGQDPRHWRRHPLGDFLVTDEMVRGVLPYVNLVREVYDSLPGAVMQVEQRLEMGFIDPGMKGTADCLVGVPFQVVHVFDYKNGTLGVDHPEHNSQLWCYGAAAARAFCAPTIVLHIFQPWSYDYKAHREHEFTRAELDAHVVTLQEAAVATHDEDAEFNPGDHCRKGFCDWRPMCPAYAEISPVRMGFDLAKRSPKRKVPDLSDISEDDARLLAILEVADQAADLIKQVKAHAVKRELDGNPIPGTKPVQGISRRRWKDGKDPEGIVRAAARLAETITPADCRKDPDVRSVKQIEDLLKEHGVDKKARDTMLRRWAEKPRGKMSVVPDSDPRERMDWRKHDARQLFAEYIEER